MVKVDRGTWKKIYFERLNKLMSEFSKVLVVGVDNVGSKQMQEIRRAMRGHGEIIMGKNTMIRRCVQDSEHEDFKALLPYIRGNVGFVFTDGDLSEIRDMITSNKVAAPARVGAIAPVPVVIPKGNTGMGPEKTSFFQALNIMTKITRGTIEILNDVNLLSVGDKVGASEAALLNMLGVSPFSYGLIVEMIYDNGSVYGPEVLDITQDDLRAKFMAGVRNVAAVSLALGLPNAASVPHMIVNGYKNVLSVALATDISFPLAEKAKAFLADPSAFVVAAAPAAAAAGDAGAAAAAAPEPEEEEEEEDMDFDLFD